MINNYLFLFMYDIGICLGKLIDLDEEFYRDIVNFLLGFDHSEKNDVINKILCIDRELKAGDKIIFPVPSDSNKLANYMNSVIYDDKKLSRVFDQVGFEDTQKIASLAENFISYMYTINEMVYSKKIRN